MLLLPGADCWNNPEHVAIVEKAGELLSAGAVVGAICGATVALANARLLDNRRHTSNWQGFLEMFSPAYKGQKLYIDEMAVSDSSLITAGPAGSLLWAKLIIQRLGVFRADTLERWYEYFKTGKADVFFSLMQTPQPENTE